MLHLNIYYLFLNEMNSNLSNLKYKILFRLSDIAKLYVLISVSEFKSYLKSNFFLTFHNSQLRLN